MPQPHPVRSTIRNPYGDRGEACNAAPGRANFRLRAEIASVEGPQGVMPADGLANPTPTVAAPALRVAEHLRDKLRAPRAADRPLTA